MDRGYHAYRQLFFQAAVDKIPGLFESAGDAAYLVVESGIGRVQADGDGARGELFQLPEQPLAPDGAVGYHRQLHAELPHAGRYREEIPAQQGFAAHQGHAPAAGPLQVFAELQRFLRRQLRGAPAAGRGAAVQAFQIAGQRQFPDDAGKFIICRKHFGPFP